MTAYVIPEDMRLYLDKVPTGGPADELLDLIGVRATDIVDTYLGFSFDGYTTEGRVVFGIVGSPYLYLPAHAAGSVTGVLLGTGTDALTDWSEQSDGSLLRTNISGIYGSSYLAGQPWGWGGYGYTITADWGYGDPPEAVKEVALEIAINIYRSRDKGLYTDVIGVEGSGGIRYIGGLTKQQADILKRVQDKYAGSVVFS